MKNRVFFVAFLVFFTSQLISLSVSFRSFDHQGFTRIVFEGDNSFEYKYKKSTRSIELEINKRVSVKKNVIEINNSVLLDRVVHLEGKNKSVFAVLLKSRYKIRRNFVLERPFRVVFDLEKSLEPKQDVEPQVSKTSTSESGRNDAVKPKNQETLDDFSPRKSKKSTTIETICIDPGHGGTDIGAVGRSGLKEKDITLKVSQKLKSIIESKLGLRVVMTRDKDSEVSLNSRVSIANNQKAQIFVSIHVNSSFRRGARGPETFFVSLKATDQEAFDLAQKENAAFENINNTAENDDLKMILWNMAQTEYIRESSKLAEFIQGELNILLSTINRGVKQAPFRVLMRAAMPAVLVEIAFLSNAVEEKRMKENAFLGRVAQSIYLGISKYIYYQNNINR
jgi:N-acetylmuramoyl-L-alanine amidase